MFSSHAFFHDFSEQHLMKLASGAKPFRLQPGEYLAKEGSAHSSLYMVQSGHIAIEMHRPDGSTVTLQTVGPGDLVGWSWLVPPHRWQFDCRATDETSGLGFDGTWLRELCEVDQVLGYRILKQMIILMYNRNAATRSHLLDLYK
jgi:CRP-like cAMP-binding protein